MKPTERRKRLNEIADLLKTMFNSNDKYNGLSASFFSPHYFSTADQGIKISYAGNDSSVLADVLGFIDVPAMMNDLLIETASGSSGMKYVFIYDDEKFCSANLKKLVFATSEEIFNKH